MGNTLLVHEVFWSEAHAILTKGNNAPALVGINQMLDQGGTQPGLDWQGRRPWLKDYPLCSGYKLRDYQGQGASAIVDSDLLLTDDMGTGKQQPIDTKVLTPFGWVEIQYIQPGHYVIGSNGKPTLVTGVYPQGIKPSYRVHFSDHSSVEAGPEHLWGIDYWKAGKHKSRLVLTTEELRMRPKKGTLDLSKTTLHLPMLKAPVEFINQDLPLDSYFLGCMIANGSLSSSQQNPNFTCHTKDFEHYRHEFNTAGIKMNKHRFYGNVAQLPISYIYNESFIKIGLKGHLSGTKFIPRPYLMGSPEQRIALLQGMMDGDGSCSKTNNRLTYSTSSHQLAEDLQELVEGLGGVASIKGYLREDKDKKVEYHVRLRLPEWVEPFRLQRKLERFCGGRLSYPTRTVTKVEYVRDVESVCISVAAEDRLYVTEHSILTHNSVQVLAARIALMREHQVGWRTIILVPSAEVASAWRRMAFEHFGQVVWHIEDRKDFGRKFMQATGIWVCMYSKFWREGYLEHLRYQLSLGGGMLVCDEFHRCAGAETKQYFYCNELRELAYRFVGATGTSVPNRPDSYHAMYTITNKQSTLNLEYWNAYFSRGLTDATGKKPDWDITRLKSIYALRGTYSLRRLKSEVANLPPLTGPIPVVCPMPAAMRKHYVDLHNQNKTEFPSGDTVDEVTIGHFYTKHLRLYQCSTLPSLLGITGPGSEPTHKLNRLIELLEEAGEQRVLIWSNFPDCIEWLAEKIRVAMPRTVTKTAHGRVSQADRSRLVDQFQEGLINYLVANPMVWGEGITLTAASVVIYWDLHPSRVRWRQSQDRAYRIGQVNPVTIYTLLHEDSIDIHTLNWLGTKDMWADAIETGRGERQVNRVDIGNPYGKLKR